MGYNYVELYFLHPAEIFSSNELSFECKKAPKKGKRKYKINRFLLSSNPFDVTGLFLYPLKASESQIFSEGIVHEMTRDMKWVNLKQISVAR